MIKVPDPELLITKIRAAVAERGLKLSDIISLMEEKGEYPVAPATLSRLLSDDIGGNSDYLKTIIPVYNTLSYLPRCLDSVRSQTFSDLEILCVDDVVIP